MNILALYFDLTGFPLLIAYLALLLVISYSILNGLRKGQAKDPFFMAIDMSWLAYQVQASVSINQIGVGVWGWIIQGLMVTLVLNEKNFSYPIPR